MCVHMTGLVLVAHRTKPCLSCTYFRGLLGDSETLQFPSTFSSSPLFLREPWNKDFQIRIPHFQTRTPLHLEATDVDRHTRLTFRLDVLPWLHFLIGCFLQVLATWFLGSDIVCAHETWKILSLNFGMTPAIVRVYVWRECCRFSVAG